MPQGRPDNTTAILELLAELLVVPRKVVGDGDAAFVLSLTAVSIVFAVLQYASLSSPASLYH